jgi:Domain of unknown function (DU1801)
MEPTDADVDAYLDALADERRRAEARTLAGLMADVTGERPVMWGPSIVGFGTYHYRYASGREGDSPVAAFAPRAREHVVYLVSGFQDRYAKDVAALGPHRTGKGCLYLKSLDGVDLDVLRRLVDRSMRVARDVDAAR